MKPSNRHSTHARSCSCKVAKSSRGWLLVLPNLKNLYSNEQNGFSVNFNNEKLLHRTEPWKMCDPDYHSHRSYFILLLSKWAIKLKYTYLLQFHLFKSSLNLLPERFCCKLILQKRPSGVKLPQLKVRIFEKSQNNLQHVALHLCIYAPQLMCNFILHLRSTYATKDLDKAVRCVFDKRKR